MLQKNNELKIRGSADVRYLGKAIDQMVWEFMEEKGIPGLTLAIVQAPYIPRVVGYGMSDLEQRRLASPITVWPAAQISQAFAAVAVMQLYEEGKLALEEKAGAYLDDLPAAWGEITVEQLLGHTAGLADYRGQAGYDPSKSYTYGELIHTVEGLPLVFAPGTDVSQSATNFLVLTEIVERVAKMSYQEFVTKRQIEYVGLLHTCFSDGLDSLNHEDVSETANVHQKFKSDPYYVNPSEVPVGYDKDLKKTKQVPSAAMKGFADIWASAEDISRWDICLAGSILIADPENRKRLYGAISLKDGTKIPGNAGWQFYGHKGLMDIKGTIPGFSTFLSRFTDASELVCVTLMANKEGIDFSNLGRKIAAAFGDALATGSDDKEMNVYECPYDVKRTVEKLEADLKSRNIPVFAKFDHQKNAEGAGLSMKPTQVLVFGAPAVGTKLMWENPSLCLELPLKIAVWEDETGSTWMGFNRMDLLARRYHLEGNPIIGNMQKLLEDMALKAANVY